MPQGGRSPGEALNLGVVGQASPHIGSLPFFFALRIRPDCYSFPLDLEPHRRGVGAGSLVGRHGILVFGWFVLIMISSTTARARDRGVPIAAVSYPEIGNDNKYNQYDCDEHHSPERG